MITMKEILKDKKIEDQSKEIQDNLAILHYRINIIRKAYNRPMSITSGLRTMEDHLRIYENKAKKEGKTFDKSKVPMKSKHLYGAAIDISDPNKELQAWCLKNVDVLEKTQLWLEDFSASPQWVHLQIYQPKSGKRFFLP